MNQLGNLINIENMNLNLSISFENVMDIFKQLKPQLPNVYIEMHGDGLSQMFHGLVQNKSGVIIILENLTVDGHPAEINGLGVSSTSSGGLGFDMAKFPEYIFNEPRRRITLTAHYHTQDGTGRSYKYTAYGKQVPRVPGDGARFNIEFKKRPTIREI